MLSNLCRELDAEKDLSQEETGSDDDLEVLNTLPVSESNINFDTEKDLINILVIKISSDTFWHSKKSF